MNRGLFYKKLEKILINKIKLSTNAELDSSLYFIVNLHNERKGFSERVCKYHGKFIGIYCPICSDEFQLNWQKGDL